MIAQVLSREFVAAQLGDAIALFDGMLRELAAGGGPRLAERVMPATVPELEMAREAVAALKASGLPLDGLSTAWISRDPVASILQSALEASYLEANAVEPAAQGLASADVAITDMVLRPSWAAPAGPGLFAQFDGSDVRWVLGFLAARGVAGWHGKHAFPTRPARVPLPERARLLLVGDWGSGLPRARLVADQMRRRLLEGEAEGRACHVLHLGDVYYSGFAREYRSRFLKHWPVRPEEAARFGSWCLNGNHDMFSGGYGYFDMLRQPPLAGHDGTSYFCLENDRWQFIGLDSAYDLHGMRGEEGDLHDPQVEWLQRLRREGASRRAVLFSHHQLFSAYEHGSPRMEEKVRPILQDEPATAWFWGHEHACVAYKPHALVRHPRLIGHGGVPVKPLSGTMPDAVAYEFRDSLRSGLNRFGRFGFAMMDVDPEALSVSYISELGQVHHSEVIAWV